MIQTDIFKRLLPTLATILVLGSFLAILGPYQTHQLGLPGVWFYWVGLMGLGWLSNALVQAGLGRLTGGWPRLAHYALASVLISIPVTVGVAAIQALVSRPFTLAALPVVFVFVWVISAAVTTIGWLMDRRATAAPEIPTIGRTLLDKLPPRLQRAPLLALQAEDHYLRVHTGAGDALILMRQRCHRRRRGSGRTPDPPLLVGGAPGNRHDRARRWPRHPHAEQWCRGPGQPHPCAAPARGGLVLTRNRAPAHTHTIMFQPAGPSRP